MESIRKENIERKHEADLDPIERVLQDIAEDARALKHRYLRDTIVPEGGE